MTAPRIVARGATYAVTRRCVCRKAFLGWWHPEVDDVFYWCLAVVGAKCGVEIHHAVRVGSHYHLTITVIRENLGEFLRLLNHSLSRMLNALLEREGYEAPRELFDARGSHVMRLMDAEAQLTHVVYERTNPPAAGLADTCDGVPGRTLELGLWKGAGVVLRRPRVARSGEDSRVLRVSPPAALYRAFGGDVDALVHHERKLEREVERVIRASRGPARTAAQVRAIDPWDEPLTERESGGRVPSFKTGLEGFAGKEARIRGAREVRAFRELHHAANDEWRGGNREVVYPHGTYEMRRFHGVDVAEPAADAWVSAPEPTLDEVKAELERDGAKMDDGLVERVREAVVCAAEAMSDEPDVETDVVEEDDGDAKGGDCSAPDGPAARRKRPRRRVIRRRRRRRGNTDPPVD